MKLTYRGISYEYNTPEVEIAETETAGKYRGLDWRFRNLKKAPVQQATLDLKYRGVAYRTNETAPEQEPVAVPAAVAHPEPVAAATFSAVDKARLLMTGHHRAIKNRQQSLLSRSAAEAGLMNVASLYWNHIQGQIHPSFRATYERSHATLS